MSTIAWEDTLEGLAGIRDRYLAARTSLAYRCPRCREVFPFECRTLGGPHPGRQALVHHKARKVAAQQDTPREQLVRLRDAYATQGSQSSLVLDRILAAWDQLPEYEPL